MTEQRCPQCRKPILQKTTEGGHTIKSRIMIIDADGKAKAKCNTCKTMVSLKITVTKT